MLELRFTLTSIGEDYAQFTFERFVDKARHDCQYSTVYEGTEIIDDLLDQFTRQATQRIMLRVESVVPRKEVVVSGAVMHMPSGEVYKRWDKARLMEECTFSFNFADIEADTPIMVEAR